MLVGDVQALIFRADEVNAKRFVTSAVMVACRVAVQLPLMAVIVTPLAATVVLFAYQTFTLELPVVIVALRDAAEPVNVDAL